MPNLKLSEPEAAMLTSSLNQGPRSSPQVWGLGRTAFWYERQGCEADSAYAFRERRLQSFGPGSNERPRDYCENMGLVVAQKQRPSMPLQGQPVR
jgi:hypothetical protein